MNLKLYTIMVICCTALLVTSGIKIFDSHPTTVECSK